MKRYNFGNRTKKHLDGSHSINHQFERNLMDFLAHTYEQLSGIKNSMDTTEGFCEKIEKILYDKDLIKELNFNSLSLIAEVVQIH